MSLAALNLHVLRNVFEALKREAHPNRRVVSLGYPDVLATPAQVSRVVGDDVLARAKLRPDGAAIRRWHKLPEHEPVVDTASLFAALGYELEVIDAAEIRGGERVHDLNHPIPAELHERYAVVIDAGTMEHCFNIAQAACNIAQLAALGGFVMHGNPLNMYNHGFYNLNPTWYREYYRANGFSLESAMLVSGPIEKQEVAEVPVEDRFGGVPENSVLLVLARRRERREIVWPLQQKYGLGSPHVAPA